jgi:hypothetical protein
MVLATKAAMRDAAAKFLVQFPEQEVTRKLLAGTPLQGVPVAAVAADAAAASAVSDDVEIEVVPIVESAAPPAPEKPAEPAQDLPEVTPPPPQSLT